MIILKKQLFINKYFASYANKLKKLHYSLNKLNQILINLLKKYKSSIFTQIKIFISLLTQ